MARIWLRVLARGVAVLALASLVFGSLVGDAGARRIEDGLWTHDHSSAGIPPRPRGYADLVDTFGPRCTDRSNDARTLWPSQSAPHEAGYIYFHPYLHRNVSWNIRNHVDAARKNGALYPGIGAYNCRLISGSTSWSVHSWGAAIDTNWLRNPMGQDSWNGQGADGVRYGTYLPDVYRGAFPGHNFFWGLNWDSRPDPMHFQYVTNY